MPFWDEAVQSEATAAARVRAMADVEPDALLREAIAMQAYEEERHALLLESLTQRYGITVGAGRPPAPRDAEWAFLRMGYGECFDSFFAFGLFRLSADTGLFPEPLVRVFDGVMDEEARHILFFTNWVAYRRLGLPFERRAWFLVRRGLGLSLQAFGRVRTALHLRSADAGDDFTMQVPEAVVEVCDVAEGSSVERVVKAVLDRWGRVDLLVNNAGYGRHVLFKDHDVADIERMMRTNYLGTVYATKAVLPDMRGRGRGWIVNVSSVAGKLGQPDEAAYSASKFAVAGR